MLKLAVIGGGRWGPNLIRNLNDGVRSKVVRAIDVSAAQRTLLSQHYSAVEVSAQASDAFDDPEIDAVVIATPTSTHYELAKRALEQGKHVLVEKPITTRLSEADALTELAAGKGLILMVGHLFVFNDGVVAAKRYIDDGTLGAVYYISMVRTNLGPIRPDVNAAWDLASHDISIANYWLDTAPLRASAVGHAWINDGVEDAVFATLHYPNNILVNMHVSWLNPRKARDITITGDRRMLTFDDMNMQEPLRIYDKYVSDERSATPIIDNLASFRSSLRDGDITIPKVQAGEPLKVECEHFLASVESGQAPRSGGREGADVVATLEAIERSIRNGGAPEDVDP